MTPLVQLEIWSMWVELLEQVAVEQAGMLGMSGEPVEPSEVVPIEVELVVVDPVEVTMEEEPAEGEQVGVELVVPEEAEVGADLEVYPEAKVKTVIAAQLELEALALVKLLLEKGVEAAAEARVEATERRQGR